MATKTTTRKASSRNASPRKVQPKRATARPAGLVGTVPPSENPPTEELPSREESDAANIAAKDAAAPQDAAAKDLGDFVTAVRAAIGRDSATIRDADGTEQDAAWLYAFVHSFDSVADTARDASISSHDADEALARAVLTVRASIRLTDGLPDWAGSKATAKTAVLPLVKRAVAPFEEYETTRNRVNRIAQRMRARFVADWIVKADGLSVTDEQCKSAAESTTGQSDDPAVQDLMRRMEVQYREEDGKVPPKNAPRTPWRAAAERNGTESNGTGHRAETKQDKAAREAREASEAFAALRTLHASHLSSPAIVNGLFGIAADLYKVLASARPRLAGTKREDLASDLYSLGRIFTVAGEVLHNGGPDNLSAASKADLVTAMAKSVAIDKGTGDDAKKDA